jgi:hypothetical protein
VPLLTVEQGHRNRFELDAGDATVLLQIPSRDVMWQKQRLLNRALAALPPDCYTVAWLDSDILFERADWPRRAMDALEQTVMVQLFRRASYLPRDVGFSRPLAEQSYLQRRSAAFGLVGGGLAQNAFVTSLEALKAHGMASDYCNGHAWVMRRDLLRQARFYEAMVVGGGDYVFLQAALGQFETVRHGHGWTAPDSRQYRHFLRWAERLYTVVQGASAWPRATSSTSGTGSCSTGATCPATECSPRTTRPRSRHRHRRARPAPVELGQARVAPGGARVLPRSPGRWSRLRRPGAAQMPPRSTPSASASSSGPVTDSAERSPAAPRALRCRCCGSHARTTTANR